MVFALAKEKCFWSNLIKSIFSNYYSKFMFLIAGVEKKYIFGSSNYPKETLSKSAGFFFKLWYWIYVSFKLLFCPRKAIIHFYHLKEKKLWQIFLSTAFWYWPGARAIHMLPWKLKFNECICIYLFIYLFVIVLHYCSVHARPSLLFFIFILKKSIVTMIFLLIAFLSEKYETSNKIWFYSH